MQRAADRVHGNNGAKQISAVVAAVDACSAGGRSNEHVGVNAVAFQPKRPHACLHHVHQGQPVSARTCRLGVTPECSKCKSNTLTPRPSRGGRAVAPHPPSAWKNASCSSATGPGAMPRTKLGLRTCKANAVGWLMCSAVKTLSVEAAAKAQCPSCLSPHTHYAVCPTISTPSAPLPTQHTYVQTHPLTSTQRQGPAAVACHLTAAVRTHTQPQQQ